MKVASKRLVIIISSSREKDFLVFNYMIQQIELTNGPFRDFRLEEFMKIIVMPRYTLGRSFLVGTVILRMQQSLSLKSPSA